MTAQNRLLCQMQIFALSAMLLFGVVSNASGGETITFFHNDIAGSPMLATDANGLVAWKEHYRPYGDRVVDSPASTNNALWYTGKPHDEQTGLTYMGARYYDPAIGRFMGIDPAPVDLDDLHSVNRYTYANNNPYKFNDPNGMDAYLVSRPLSFTDRANHNFIVINAESLGDPNATVYSFGDRGDDTMGRVTEDTEGFSEGTNDSDRQAWEGLSGEASTSTYRQIDATDQEVDTIVHSMVEGHEYSAVPELYGGVNSNTAAGAIAREADGGEPRVSNGQAQPGSSVRVVEKIKFEDSAKRK